MVIRGDFLGARPEPTRSQTWFFMIGMPVMWVGFGVFMVVTGVQHRNAVQPIPGGQTVPGVIAARHYVGKGVYEPIVRFRDRTGAVHRFTGVSGDKSPVGTRVEVSYDPQDPTRAHDLSQDPNVWGQLSLGIWLLVADAVVAALLGWVIWRTKRRRGQRDRRAA